VQVPLGIKKKISQSPVILVALSHLRSMMESHSSKETLYPRFLSLRIHSSILQSTEENEASIASSGENDILLLPDDVVFGSLSEQIGDETTKLQSTDKTANDAPIYTREESVGGSHVFLMDERMCREQASDDGASNNRFDFVASIAYPQRIVVQPSTDKIKELGRRARARKEQERQNRKGIKIFDDSALVAEQIQQQEKKSMSLSKSNANISSLTTTGTKKRQPQQTRRSSQAQLRAAKAKRKLDKLVWRPDLSQIEVPFEDEQSSYVRLHGLPVGSNFELVRKFFTGLVPERILLLLSNRREMWESDASYDDLPSYNLRGAIYTNDEVRVVVKFDSVSAARLAVERSGETILSKHLVKHNRRGIIRDLPDEFSIGVTHVSKELSSHLSRLSIDAVPGVPFDACLRNVESELDPIVRGTLWSSARRACSIRVDNEIKRCNIFMDKDDNLDDCTSNEMDFLSFAGYQKNAKHHNRLLRIYEDLIGSITINGPDDATISSDPLVRLTAQACSVLEDEMDRIDIVLHQYRTSRFR